jgi:hypothetical protein
VLCVRDWRCIVTTLLEHTLARIADALESRAAEHDCEALHASTCANKPGLVSYSVDEYRSVARTYGRLAEECRDIAGAIRKDTLDGCPDLYPDGGS